MPRRDRRRTQRHAPLTKVKTAPIFRFCASVVSSPETERIRFRVSTATPQPKITLPLIPHRLTKRRKAAGGQSAAGVIKVIARIIRTPCLQHRNQLTVSDMRRGQVLGQIGQSGAFDG